MNTIDFVLNGNSINCGPITLREYLALCFTRNKDTSDDLKKHIIDILSRIDMQLNKHEAEFALIQLLSRSLSSDNIKTKFVCECDNIFEVEIPIKNTRLVFNGPEEPNLYPIQRYKLELKWPELFDDDDIFTMVVKSIVAVHVGSERIELSDLNSTELDDLLGAISRNDVESIKNELIRPQSQLFVQPKCPKCGKVHLKTLSTLKDFIEVL